MTIVNDKALFEVDTAQVGILEVLDKIDSPQAVQDSGLRSGLYEAVFHSTPNPICVVAQGTPEAPGPVVIDFNPAYQDRHSPLPLGPGCPFGILEPELFLAHRDDIRRASEAGPSSRHDIFSRRTGLWDSVTIFPGPLGQAILLFVDITEAKRSQSRAEESAARLRTYFETGAIKLVVGVPSGTILEANEAAARFYGYPRGELVGKPVADLEADLATANSSVVVPREQVGRFETLHRLRSGDLREVEVHTSLGRWGSDECLFCVIFDQTQKHAMMNRLAQQEKLAHIGSLSANLMHEMGNILSAVRGHVQLFLLDHDDPVRVQRRLELIDQQFARTHELTRAIKDLALDRPVVRSPVDLNQVLQTVFALEGPLIKQRGVELVTSRSPEPAVVIANESLVQQLFLNIVINGLEALGDQDHPRLEVTTKVSSGTVGVHLANNGPPIPDNLRSKLFRDAVTSKPLGSGLGLSFCRLVAETHGGSVQLAPGASTEFIVRFPLAETVE